MIWLSAESDATFVQTSYWRHTIIMFLSGLQVNFGTIRELLRAGKYGPELALTVAVPKPRGFTGQEVYLRQWIAATLQQRPQSTNVGYVFDLVDGVDQKV